MEGGGKMIGIGLTAVPVLAGMIYTSGSWVDDRYYHTETAHSSHQRYEGDLWLVGARLEQKIQGDRLQQLDDRIWRYEQKYAKQLESQNSYDDDVKEEYHKLLQERTKLEKEMKLLDERIMDYGRQQYAPSANPNFNIHK